LKFAIGGQISIDVFPEAWTKAAGGNDYVIGEDGRTIAHAVTDPADTLGQCRRIFFASDPLMDLRW
jgi:phosphomannomutase